MTIHILSGSELEHLRKSINNDPEFKIVGRYVTVNIVMIIGADKWLFNVHKGEIKEIRPVLPMIDTVHFFIKGSEEFWEKLLLPLPPPRFQNLKAGMRAGNCEIYGDMELYSAYFSAINRITAVMRELQNA
jgi:hypothetical protein